MPTWIRSPTPWLERPQRASVSGGDWRCGHHRHHCPMPARGRLRRIHRKPRRAARHNDDAGERSECEWRLVHQRADGRASGCLRLLHALQRPAELARPKQQWGVRQVETPLQQLGVSSSRLQSAQAACRHLAPNGGRSPDQAQLQQMKAQALQFSQCVRAHGVPNFPDPDSTGRIPDPASVGIDQGAPKFQAATRPAASTGPRTCPRTLPTTPMPGHKVADAFGERRAQSASRLRSRPRWASRCWLRPVAGRRAARWRRSARRQRATAHQAQRTRRRSHSRVMHTHRVPLWPHPESNGTFDKSKLTPAHWGSALADRGSRTSLQVAAADLFRDPAAGRPGAGAEVLSVHARRWRHELSRPREQRRDRHPARDGKLAGLPDCPQLLRAQVRGASSPQPGGRVMSGHRHSRPLLLTFALEGAFGLAMLLSGCGGPSSPGSGGPYGDDRGDHHDNGDQHRVPWEFDAAARDARLCALYACPGRSELPRPQQSGTFPL